MELLSPVTAVSSFQVSLRLLRKYYCIDKCAHCDLSCVYFHHILACKQNICCEYFSLLVESFGGWDLCFQFFFQCLGLNLEPFVHWVFTLSLIHSLQLYIFFFCFWSCLFLSSFLRSVKTFAKPFTVNSAVLFFSSFFFFISEFCSSNVQFPFSVSTVYLL